jgi:hypothetical protein
MKASWWISGFLLPCVCATGIANADTLAEYESFDYTAGSSINLQNGGSGWSGTWQTPGGLDAIIGGSSLTSGNLAVSGGALTTAGSQPPNQGSSVATWVRALGTPLGADNSTAYLSFLFRPNAGYGFYGGLNFGGVFVGLSGNQAYYGLEGPGNDISLSSVPVVTGQTVFFVLRADFLPGNDRLSLYLNPTVGAPEPAVPSVLKTDLDVGSVNSITVNNYGGFTTDEIRIGDTYASVTPVESATPEPAFGVLTGVALATLMFIDTRRRYGRRRTGARGPTKDSTRLR